LVANNWWCRGGGRGGAVLHCCGGRGARGFDEDDEYEQYGVPNHAAIFGEEKEQRAKPSFQVGNTCILIIKRGKYT
jgi:hypothetical protein